MGLTSECNRPISVYKQANLANMNSMKTGFIAVAAFLLAAVQAVAADYVITSLPNPDKEGYYYDFYGFGRTDTYTSNIAIPPNPTTGDNVTMYGFYDLKTNASVSANVFNFYSSGIYGNGTSWYAKTKITAKEFNIYYKSKDAEDYSNAAPVDFVNVFQTYDNPVELAVGSMTLKALNVGENYVNGNAEIVFSKFDDEIGGAATISTLRFRHSKTEGQVSNTTLTINEKFSLTVGSFYADDTGVSDGNTSLVHINGGVLNLGSFTHRNVKDVFTIKHSSGTLAATANLTIDAVSGGSLTYALGENSVFDTNGNTIAIGSGVTVAAADGAAGGFTVKGGGALSIAADVSAVTGNVSVEDGSSLSLSGGWISNAQSLTVGAGSSVSSSTDILLNADALMVIGVAGGDSYGKISGELVGDSFGKLYFQVDSSADGVFSINLSDIIQSESDIDWSKFEFESNVQFGVDNGVISFNVPEPAEWAALMGFLSLAAAFVRRRK